MIYNGLITLRLYGFPFVEIRSLQLSYLGTFIRYCLSTRLCPLGNISLLDINSFSPFLDRDAYTWACEASGDSVVVQQYSIVFSVRHIPCTDSVLSPETAHKQRSIPTMHSEMITHSELKMFCRESVHAQGRFAMLKGYGL